MGGSAGGRAANGGAADDRRWTVVNGRPDERQLAAIVEHVVNGVRPERIIVFGSAARAAMTPDSDLDLLIVKDVDDLGKLATRTRSSLPTVHPPVDVVAATMELLDEHRDSPGWVYRPAVAEGLVVYDRARPSRGRTRRAIDTLPARSAPPAQAMVKRIRYDEEEALDWLENAEADMSVVDAESGAIHPTARCISAQAAAEKALKALLTARGRAIPFRHDLVDLGTEVRKAGENLPDTVTISKLQDLSEYGGPAQYPRWRGRTTARRLRESCDTARALTGHARRRVPEILENRRRKPIRQGPADEG